MRGAPWARKPCITSLDHPPPELALRYSGHTRSCCVTGRLVSARSNRRRVRVMNFWPSMNSRYLGGGGDGREREGQQGWAQQGCVAAVWHDSAAPMIISLQAAAAMQTDSGQTAPVYRTTTCRCGHGSGHATTMSSNRFNAQPHWQPFQPPGRASHDPDAGHLVHGHHGALKAVVERLHRGVVGRQAAHRLQPLAQVGVPQLCSEGR